VCWRGLGVVEQRYRAVLEVLEDGAPVTEVARRYGVARQTVHEWLARYARGGLGGLADRSSQRRLRLPDQRPLHLEPGAGQLSYPARRQQQTLKRSTT
jgi:transposase-like protein